ncbi:MAG TPA: prephenate dehydrogenase/arogenate dehydrogenase family protein [Polyangia bacterium]|nr:prephenate dehydrogenase/arogenate dehydrogenase family protein [Polyangia bacterium]
MTRFAEVALVGTGHIGGSLVLALRAAGGAARVVGFDRDPAHAARARERGIVDTVAASAAAAVAGADLVLLAVPVRALPALLADIATALPRGCLVHDVGSTKARIVAAAEATLPAPGRFVGGHPLAGLERSGPDAADAELFRDKKVFLTPTARTEPTALAAAEALWAAAGARTVRMEAGRHDALMAAVSHLPHAVAYALTAAVAAYGPETAGLSAGGFRDTTRIASSDPTMWRDIFLDNQVALCAMLDQFGKALAHLRSLIEAGEAAPLERELGRLRAQRERILG